MQLVEGVGRGDAKGVRWPRGVAATLTPQTGSSAARSGVVQRPPLCSPRLSQAQRRAPRPPTEAQHRSGDQRKAEAGEERSMPPAPAAKSISPSLASSGLLSVPVRRSCGLLRLSLCLHRCGSVERLQ